MRKKKYRKPGRGLGLIAVVVLLLCAVVTFRRKDLDVEYTMKAQEMESLEQKKQKLLDERNELEEYKAYVQTKRYIEQVARDTLGLVYPDEILFEPE